MYWMIGSIYLFREYIGFVTVFPKFLFFAIFFKFEYLLDTVHFSKAKFGKGSYIVR
jgi:hypothetical protein